MLRKSFLFYLFVLFLVIGCNKNETLYKVIKIKDGDTMELLSPDHQQITVRLSEIDCPEKNQAFGQAAKQFTANLCFGKMVKLEGSQHDRYGRTVGQVLLDNGTNITYEIVKNGYAWQFRAYSKNMELAGLEQQARENKLGLWQDANPTPPWNFRKGEKTRRATAHVKKAKKARRHYKKRRAKYRDTIVF